MIEGTFSIVSWPMAVLGLIVAVIVATWPISSRLARESNLAAAGGDFAASLASLERLRVSWLPAAAIERLFNPGHYETLIAVRLHQLDRPQKTLDWCQRGLNVARRPRTKAYLNDLAAVIWAGLGDTEQCRHFLCALLEVLRKHPMPDHEWAPTAILCENSLGHLDVAWRFALEESRRRAGQVSHRWLATTASVLTALGRHEEVLSLTAWLLEQHAPKPGTSLSEAQNPEAAIGSTQVRTSYLRTVHGESLIFAAESARRVDQWELAERYLALAESLSPSNPVILAQLIALRAIHGAHEGDRATVITAETTIDHLAARHPQHRGIVP